MAIESDRGVDGCRSGRARGRSRWPLRLSSSERQAGRATAAAPGGADTRRPGTKRAALAPGRDARRGAAGVAAGRGSGRPAEPVRRGGRDPRSSEGRGGRGRDSMSGIEKKPVYTPDDLAGFDPASRLGAPGAYPFTRGIHPTMYRGKLWTMRQFAGFGSAEDTNRRYKFLLEHGQTGLSVAFDFPTLMGYDSDHTRAEGEVGNSALGTAPPRAWGVLFPGSRPTQSPPSMRFTGPARCRFSFY